MTLEFLYTPQSLESNVRRSDYNRRQRTGLSGGKEPVERARISTFRADTVVRFARAGSLVRRRQALELLLQKGRRAGEHAQVHPELQHVPGHVRSERGRAFRSDRGRACAFDDILDPANSEPVKKDGFNVVSYVMATDFALESPRVAFALQLQHAAISALGLLTQLCRASLLHHTTAFEHHNLVGIVNRAHAMCDNEYRLALK